MATNDVSNSECRLVLSNLKLHESLSGKDVDTTRHRILSSQMKLGSLFKLAILKSACSRDKSGIETYLPKVSNGNLN